MRHANNFDGVRLLAALGVVTSHQSLMMGREQPRIGPIDLGTLAVLVFFSLSGYLVAASWSADPAVGRFAARRMLRIWPAYAVVVILSAAAVLWLDADPPFTTMAAWFYLRNLAFLHFEWVYFPANPFHQLNGSLWTIPVEVACYVLIAAMGTLFRGSLRWPIIGTAVAATCWFVATDGQSVYLTTVGTSRVTQPLFFAAFFIAGALIFILGKRWLGWLVVSSFVLFAAGQWVAGCVLAVPATTLLVGSRAWPVFRNIGRFGDFSYGSYLWAFPVQQVGVLWFGHRHYVELLALTLLVTGALAWLSWHLVERPALQLKPRAKPNGHSD